MSLALSQRLEEKTSVWQRLLIGYGVTDEVFCYCLCGKEEADRFLHVRSDYGTRGRLDRRNSFGSSHLRTSGRVGERANAMGIALYAMFIAIIIPPAKKSRPVVFTILLSVAVMVALSTIPLFSVISEGFRVIIATFAAAGTAAVLFPVREEKCVSEPSHAAEESIRTSGAKEDGGFESSRTGEAGRHILPEI